MQYEEFKQRLQEKLSKIKLNEDLIPGGKGDNKSPEEIAKIHNVPVEDIIKEIELGIKTEMEHTTDQNKAKEIATDHVTEHPKYYSDPKHGLNVSEPKLDENVTPEQIKQASTKEAQAIADKAKIQAQAAKEKADQIKKSQPSVGTNLQEDGSDSIESSKEELTNTGVNAEQEQKIKDFLTTNKGLDDTKFHEFVESMGIDPHEAEELVYKIVYDLAQIINGTSTSNDTTEKEDSEVVEPVEPEESEENSEEESEENVEQIQEQVNNYNVKTHKNKYLNEAWKQCLNRK